MISNNKKHSLITKSLVVFLSLNMLACSTIKEDKVDNKADNQINKEQNVQYSNQNISDIIDKVVNKVVWNDEKMLYESLNLKFQTAQDAEKYHIGYKSFNDKYKADMLKNPQRLVLDLNGQKSLSGKNLKVGSKFVSKVRLGAHPDKTRLVFDINPNSSVYYDIKDSEKGLDVIISNNKSTVSSVSNGTAKTEIAQTKMLSNDIVSNDESSKTVADSTMNSDSNSIDNKIQASDELTKIADSEIQVKNSDDVKIANNINDKKYQISKIHCYEKADKLQVKVGVNSNVDYELNKVSKNEYALRLKNTTLSKEADKPIALPKTYSSLNSIQASKDNNDTVIKLYVNSDVALDAKNTKNGIIVSESKVDNQIMIADNQSKIDETKLEKATIEKIKDMDPKDNVKAQMDLSKVNNDDKKNDEVENTNNQEGVIDIEDLIEDDKKGLGNDDEKANDGLEDLDEEISKLLDPASGYTGKLISLDFQDTDIDNALKIIAEVSNLNIVTSDDISGKVSLRLNNVPWDQALDVILKTNGLDKVQEGNVVRIAPVNRLKSEREELKAARQAEENLEPLQLAYRKVSYAKAAELQTLVESVLSDRGSVTFDDRSNQIFIKDIKPRIKDAFEIIKKADLRTPQILLETQIIEAKRDLVRELGSEFGFSVIQSNETGNGTGYNFPSSVTVSGSNGEGGNFSSFPSSGSAVSFIFDSLDGTKSLAARISGYEEEGKAKIISKPSVVTTNNTPAEIKSVETMHIRLPEGGTSIATGHGSSASGASKTATESIDVGITLKVTPQASPDYYVLLDVMGESSSFGKVSVDNIPNIIIRRATSTVLVSSGQTFALGGIYKISDNDNVSGVPFLKDIPVLGHLFRKSRVDNSDEELLFFVTPRIVEGSFDDAK